MTLWFYIFIISLVGIAAVLGLRVFEDTRGTLRIIAPLRKGANIVLEKVIRFGQNLLTTGLKKLWNITVRAGKRLFYNTTLRKTFKRIFVVFARITHDIVVVFLRGLSRLRQWIQSVHDKYTD